MERQELEDRARGVVMEHLGVTHDQVTREARFQPDTSKGERHTDGPEHGHLGCDSLDIVELTMAFEEAFNIRIEDDEAEALVTFGDAVDLVAGKVTAS